jgi:hypothetical protein
MLSKFDENGATVGRKGVSGEEGNSVLLLCLGSVKYII